MLYIRNIDDCNFKIYGSKTPTGVRVLPKNSYRARAQEPESDETYGRVNIFDISVRDKLLNQKLVSEINLDGVIYATAEAFVVAFNALMNQCCASGGGTTDLTEVIEGIDEINDKLTQMINANCCDDCRDWSIGTADGNSVTLDAGTIHSITIIVESGTVNVSNGTENADLIEGQSVTYTASHGNLTQAITIDATEGKAIYAIITCAATTTTTTSEPEVTTTTTTCDLQRIGTGTPDFISEFPSKTGGGGPN